MEFQTKAEVNFTDFSWGSRIVTPSFLFLDVALQFLRFDIKTKWMDMERLLGPPQQTSSSD